MILFKAGSTSTAYPVFPIKTFSYSNLNPRICSFVKPTNSAGIYTFPTLRANAGICTYVYNEPVLNPSSSEPCSDPKFSNAPTATITVNSSKTQFTFSDIKNCICYGIRDKYVAVMPTSLTTNITGPLYSTYSSYIHVNSIKNISNGAQYGKSFTNATPANIITVDKTHPGNIYAANWMVIACNNCVAHNMSFENFWGLAGSTSKSNWTTDDRLFWQPATTYPSANYTRFVTYVESDLTPKYTDYWGGNGGGRYVNLGTDVSDDKYYAKMETYVRLSSSSQPMTDLAVVPNGQPGALLPPIVVLDFSSTNTSKSASFLITQFGVTLANSEIRPPQNSI